jgi:hypothetical protein
LPLEQGLEFDARVRSAKKYLMLAYELPAQVRPPAATIADAYAGGAPNGRYRPFGWAHSTVADQPDAVLRPECIHDVIKLECIISPLGGIPLPGWPR